MRLSISILLTRLEIYLAKTMRFITKDQDMHVTISFDEEPTELYSFSRKYSWYPFPAALVQENLNEGFYARLRELPCRLYEVRVTKQNYLKAKKVVSPMLS